MKNILKLIAISLLLLFFSYCKEEPVGNDDSLIYYSNKWGQGSALLNGVNWPVKCSAFYKEDYSKETFGVYLGNYNQYEELRAGFNFNKIPLKSGYYYLIDFPANAQVVPDLSFSFFTSLYDGDVIGDKYILLRDSSLFITVDEIDLNDEIKGRFGGSIVKVLYDNKELDPNSPDTLEFAQGIYHCKIKRQ
jgi:hypothetical protein